MGSLLFFFILKMNTSFLEKPNTRSPGSRHKRVVKTSFFGVSRKTTPIKKNLYFRKKNAGRNNTGSITVHGRGGGSKSLVRKLLPLSDFMKYSESLGDQGNSRFLLTSIEKVPGFGRTFVGLFTPLDSPSAPEFYLPCASEMAVGDVIYGTSSEDFVTPSKKGFVSSIAQMPQNGYAFNVELSPGQGSKVARSAGSRVTLQGEDLSSTSTDGSKSFVIKLPSGATSTISGGCLGQTGFNSNEAHY